MRPALPPTDDTWIYKRPDVRLVSAQAAERVLSDSWKDWFPTGGAFFTPQYTTPPTAFQPKNTWRALFQLQIPIYDGTLGPAKRIRLAERETARLRLALTVQARSELRLAQESVARKETVLTGSAYRSIEWTLIGVPPLNRSGLFSSFSTPRGQT